MQQMYTGFYDVKKGRECRYAPQPATLDALPLCIIELVVVVVMAAGDIEALVSSLGMVRNEPAIPPEDLHLELIVSPAREEGKRRRTDSHKLRWRILPRSRTTSRDILHVPRVHKPYTLPRDLRNRISFYS
jgi:hypothetical protein